MTAALPLFTDAEAPHIPTPEEAQRAAFLESLHRVACVSAEALAPFQAARPVRPEPPKRPPSCTVEVARAGLRRALALPMRGTTYVAACFWRDHDIRARVELRRWEGCASVYGVPSEHVDWEWADMVLARAGAVAPTGPVVPVEQMDAFDAKESA